LSDTWLNAQPTWYITPTPAAAAGRQPGRAHAALGRERRDPRDVERAPGAAGLARCEANAIGLRVDRLPQPINPAKAERFID